MTTAPSASGAAPLARPVTEGASAAAAGNDVVATWRDVEQALLPIIGRRGLAALFNRSVHLATPLHGWLAAARVDAAAPVDAEPPADTGSTPLATPLAVHLADHLPALMAAQTDTQARAGARLLLQTFHGLLASLIGAPLTARLLPQTSADPPLARSGPTSPNSLPPPPTEAPTP